MQDTLLISQATVKIEPPVFKDHKKDLYILFENL